MRLSMPLRISWVGTERELPDGNSPFEAIVCCHNEFQHPRQVSAVTPVSRNEPQIFLDH
jgi:hypothetical protein